LQIYYLAIRSAQKINILTYPVARSVLDLQPIDQQGFLRRIAHQEFDAKTPTKYGEKPGIG